jgi:hypothetical protein
LKPYVLAFAALTLTGLAACEQGKPRHPPPDPMAIAPPGATPDGAAPAGVASAGLPKRPEAAGFFLDRAGAAVDPRSRQPAVTPADQATVFDGFGFDAPAKAPAKGVDIMIDGQAYGTVYGAARPDVAAFFKTPGLVNVGFKAVLPAGSLTVGAHTVVVRVVAADGKSYFDSPTVAFSVN